MAAPVAATVAELKAAVHRWKSAGLRLALVPTMGNLHQGHLALVRRAQALADRVVVSIFVNPSQFGPGEDFADYPRTERQDLELLGQAGVDLAYLPSVADMYQPAARTTVVVAGLGDGHCGAARPGHFVGVATVVCKLLNRAQPDVAVFGLKDFQQLAVIRAMVQDLDLPVAIVGVDTVRDASGLALSSRNSYLSAAQQAQAPLLYQTLCAARAAVLAGGRDYAAIARQALRALAQGGLQPEYFDICRAQDLAPPGADDTDLVLLAAARLGKARLIDNVQARLPVGHPV